MIKRIENILPFLRFKNRFLVVELLADAIKFFRVRADFYNKVFRPGKELTLTVSLNDWPAYRAELAKGLKKMATGSRVKLLIAADYRLVTVARGIVRIPRAQIELPITEADVDELVGQAMWKLFDRERVRLAKKMNVPATKIALADIQITGLKLDDHKVVSPIGFDARVAEFTLRQTFCRSELLDEIRRALPEEIFLSVGEAGAIGAELIGRLHPGRQAYFIQVFSRETYLFGSDDSQPSYRGVLAWGYENYLNFFMTVFEVGRDEAGRIIEACDSRRASPAFLKKYDSLIAEAFLPLVSGISTFLAKRQEGRALSAKINSSQPIIYLDAPRSFSRAIFSTGLWRRLNSHAAFLPADEEFIRKNFGFTVEYRKAGAPVSFSLLATLLDFYLADSVETDVSKIAKRRARWLNQTI